MSFFNWHVFSLFAAHYHPAPGSAADVYSASSIWQQDERHPRSGLLFCCISGMVSRIQPIILLSCCGLMKHFPFLQVFFVSLTPPLSFPWLNVMILWQRLENLLEQSSIPIIGFCGCTMRLVSGSTPSWSAWVPWAWLYSWGWLASPWPPSTCWGRNSTTKSGGALRDLQVGPLSYFMTGNKPHTV